MCLFQINLLFTPLQFVCVFTPSSWLVAQPICCLDTCALFLLSLSLRCKPIFVTKRKNPSSFFSPSNSTCMLKLYIFLIHFFCFSTQVQLYSHGERPQWSWKRAWKPTFGPPLQHPRVQHLSLWGVWVWNTEPAFMCAHVCAYHSCHSTPAKSVIPCVHWAGSGTLTTVKAAGMLSFIQ